MKTKKFLNGKKK